MRIGCVIWIVVFFVLFMPWWYLPLLLSAIYIYNHWDKICIWWKNIGKR